MSWHYAEDNASKGPIPEGAFVALVRAGRVKPTTLVWREGMPEWVPLSEAAPEIITAAAAAASEAEAAAVVAAAHDEIKCIECGGQFPRAQAVGLPGGWVCAMCKPMRVQKLKEGAIAAGGARMGAVHFAGFWIRFAAKFVDGLVMAVILVPLYIPMVLAVVRQAESEPSPMVLILQLLTNLAQVAVSLGYNTFFIGKYGATPGKMVCGIKVVSPTGEKISYARALGRAAAEILSGMICYIGYIIAGFDSEKRALHDHIATTRVIYGPKF
jgi:uncharacterized RDD family membrane protein YckC